MSADQDMMSTIADAGMAEADVSPMVDSTVMPCECDGRQVCEDGVCTEPEMCMGHEDCLGDRICEDGACIAGCREDGDCPRALGCDTESRRCVEVDPCTVDEHCDEGRLCLDNACTDPCASDDDALVVRPATPRRAAAWRPRGATPMKTA